LLEASAEDDDESPPLCGQSSIDRGVVDWAAGGDDGVAVVLGVVEVAAWASAAPAREPETMTAAATLFRRRDMSLLPVLTATSEQRDPQSPLRVHRDCAGAWPCMTRAMNLGCSGSSVGA
jgi:hypothetical protein